MRINRSSSIVGCRRWATAGELLAIVRTKAVINTIDLATSATFPSRFVADFVFPCLPAQDRS